MAGKITREEIESIDANQVNTTNGSNVQTEIEDLKLSVSDGKTQVKNAITDKGGTVLDADGDGVPTFSELVNGTLGIPEGAKLAEGTLSSTSDPKVIRGLSFQPKAFMINYYDGAYGNWNYRWGYYNGMNGYMEAGFRSGHNSYGPVTVTIHPDGFEIQLSITNAPLYWVAIG